MNDFLHNRELLLTSGIQQSPSRDNSGKKQLNGIYGKTVNPPIKQSSLIDL